MLFTLAVRRKREIRTKSGTGPHIAAEEAVSRHTRLCRGRR